jgi:hypothetical protein
MTKYLAYAAALGLATAAQAAIFYEPFDYATGNLGLNINPSVNQTWYSSASSGTDDRVQVASGSLSTTGLPASVGNMASLGDSGRTDRIFLGQNRDANNSTSVYWSLLMNVTDLTGAGASGATIFGFNNTAQSELNHDTAAQPSAISGRLLVKAIDASTYQIGASKASGSAGAFTFTDVAQPYSINSTVFVVGRYSFAVGADNDVFDMWVNPDPATFANDALIPAPTLSTSTVALPGADGGQIATIILRQFDNVVPAGMQYDEIRVDESWAHVTSNLIPEPSSLALAVGAAGLLMRRRMR